MNGVAACPTPSLAGAARVPLGRRVRVRVGRLAPTDTTLATAGTAPFLGRAAATKPSSSPTNTSPRPTHSRLFLPNTQTTRRHARLPLLVAPTRQITRPS